MTAPFSLPDWLPWWVPILVMVPVALYLLAFLVMPFSVLTLKSRLETIDARLDELHGEIRMLSLRLPEPGPLPGDHLATPPRDMRVRPPIPPLREEPPRAPPDEVRAAERRPSRQEPRIDWPR